MKQREVIFSPEARADLLALHTWLTGTAGGRVAAGYLARLETFCLGFSQAAERGTARNYVRPGLRVTGFERSVTIAFVVTEHRVTLVRLFYRGADWEHADVP